MPRTLLRSDEAVATDEIPRNRGPRCRQFHRRESRSILKIRDRSAQIRLREGLTYLQNRFLRVWKLRGTRVMSSAFWAGKDPQGRSVPATAIRRTSLPPRQPGDRCIAAQSSAASWQPWRFLVSSVSILCSTAGSMPDALAAISSGWASSCCTTDRTMNRNFWRVRLAKQVPVCAQRKRRKRQRFQHLRRKYGRNSATAV